MAGRLSKELSWRGKTDVVKVLLDGGADVNLKDARGRNAVGLCYRHQA